MQRKELASILLTATVTACVVAPLVLLVLMLFGVDQDLRAPLVAAVTSSVTTLAVTRKLRPREA